jgi:glyoxylase-like metal-dependent hydrolase (beta-lactamase superfamily II)
VLGTELAAARSRNSRLDRGRYRPAQWDDAVDWQPYTAEGERWFGFSCVRDLVGLPPDILIVPLAGHTLGHCGVAVRTLSGWLLHAGDAYFFRGEMNPQEYQCTPMLRFYQRVMATDNTERVRNQMRLRRLKQDHGRDIQLFCAHDAEELAMFPPTAQPAPVQAKRTIQPV